MSSFNNKTNNHNLLPQGDNVTRSIINNVSEIESRRRSITQLEQETTCRIDSLREEQLSKSTQLRNLESRESQLRLQLETLSHTVHSSKEIAADASIRVEKARVEEPVLQNLSLQKKDAAFADKQYWERGIRNAQEVGKVWSSSSSSSPNKNNNNNNNNENSSSSSLNQDCAATSTTSSDSSSNCSSVFIFTSLQKQIDQVDNELKNIKSLDTKLRSHLSDMSQKFLETRNSLSAAQSAASTLLLENKQQQQEQEKDEKAESNNNDDDDDDDDDDKDDEELPNEKKKNKNKNNNNQVEKEEENNNNHSSVLLLNEIKQAQENHQRNISHPQREIVSLESRIDELNSWLIEATREHESIKSQIEEFMKRKNDGLCSVCLLDYQEQK